MSFGKINLITPPDRLFNSNPGFMLIKPSTTIKMQFQQILSTSMEDINVFIYDTDETDIGWMISTAHQADIIIIDIDQCDSITEKFVCLLLTQPNVFYMTTDDSTPWSMISTNRIYNLDFIAEMFSDEDDFYDEEEEIDEE